MFNEPVFDPTAGGQAERTRLHPELPPPILDPTDPRYGENLTPVERRRATEVGLREPIKNQQPA